MQTNNRETWLNQLTSQFLAPHFEQAGYTIPANVRMACSLTSKKKHIGECWSSIASQDNHFEIMIVPSIADSSRVADILIHELCHAVVGIQAGHGKAFKQCALAVGLEGKMTATIASGGLKAKIAEWVQVLGEYPHAPLMQSNIKKQSTRMLKCHCPECGYQVYTSRKWIELAMPLCPDSECESYARQMIAHEIE